MSTTTNEHTSCNVSSRAAACIGNAVSSVSRQRNLSLITLKNIVCSNKRVCARRAQLRAVARVSLGVYICASTA